MIPIIVLLIVLFLIAIRNKGGIALKIWQIMLFGAIAVLITGQIPLPEAVESVNLDVILFLFGVFIVGQALEESGYLSHITFKMFKRVRTTNGLLLMLLFGMGFASALIMNDTIAIIGTPVVLLLAKQHDIDPKILLMTLAFAVTTGSVASPIGNPQNLLIAMEGGIDNPFITFFVYLFVPTVVNLLLVFLLLKFIFRKKLAKKRLSCPTHQIQNKQLAFLSKISVILLVLLIFTKVFFVLLGLDFDFRLTYIALIAALPIVLFYPKRFEVIKRIDWATLVFFAAMFVLMASVWRTGFLQSAIESSQINVLSLPSILAVSTGLSQFISNVPLVALYLPTLSLAGAGTRELMALAAGSTIAGNLTIFGAASNVIIIQNAEKREDVTLTYWEFLKIGAPLTLVNLLVYWLYLSLF